MSTFFSSKIKKVPPESELFERLKHIPSPPHTLYQIGEFHSPRTVSIIGSRKFTPYGKYVTQLISGELARNGIGIVSGLALGIDSIAHQAAIDAKGITYAVLPAGLNKIYPSSHHNLARSIVEHNGALICEEEPHNTQAFRANFVKRNRIVAGLGDVLIVIEAAQRSGTLHTVNFALEQGKDVFAVPGPINSPTSIGTNQLIQNGAQLLSSPEQILEYFDLTSTPIQAKLVFDDEFQQQIFALLEAGQMLHADVLLANLQMNARQFNQGLTMLELYGHIKNIGNNTWVRT